MKNVNQRRKYANIKLAGDSQVLGTALHQAVDRWSEQMGCTLKTGGEIDLICENKVLEYQKREARRNRYIKKRKALNITSRRSRRLSGLTKIVAKPNMTHEAARTIVEFYLKAKGRNILENNNVLFGKAFVEEHKINKRYR